MSSESASPKTQIAQDENAPGMGGTSTEDEVPAVGDENADEEQQVEEGAEDVSSEEPVADEREDRAAAKNDEPEEPKEDVVALKRQVAQADWVADTILKDPARRKQFEAWAAEDQGTKTSGLAERVFEQIDTVYQDEQDRKGIRGFMAPVLEENAALHAELAKLRTMIEPVHRTTISNEFSSALEESGVPRSVQQGKDFQKFLAAEMRDGDFARDRNGKPKYAGKNLAAKWLVRSASSASNRSVNERNRQIKNGSLNGSTPSAAGATRVYAMDPNDPDKWAKLASYRSKHGNVPYTQKKK